MHIFSRSSMMKRSMPETEDAATSAEKRQRSPSFQQPSDVLHLNVGGTLTAVLRRTLTSIEGSMLASRFSGRWDDSLEKDRDGNFFIDQPIELFQPMIDYLRARASETALAPPVTSPEFDNVRRLKDFVRMVEYFGMTPGIYPTELEMCRGEVSTAKISGHPRLGVVSSEYATFTLETRGHKRPIRSFSVILGDVEKIEIGLVRTNHFVKKLRKGEHKGVGAERYSFCLDCSQGGLLYEGSFTKLDGLTTEKGTLIRCQDKGERWLVNGQVVASSIALEDSFHLPPDLQQYSLIPAFSGKGSWQVCEVELDPMTSDHKTTISQAHL